MTDLPDDPARHPPGYEPYEPMTQTQAVELIGRVGKLAAKLELSERQAEITGELAERNARTNRWLTGAIGLLVAVVIGAGFVVAELRDLAQDNRAAATTGCENANESRAAQRALWDYIIDVSVQSNPEAPDVVTEFYVDLRTYVHAVFGDRDCADLNQKYELPDPPRIPTLDDIESEAS